MVREKHFLQIGAVVAGALAVDALFHAFFTTPFETSVYFIVKVILAAVLGYLVLQEILPKSGAVLVFVGVFALYYRVLEVVAGIPFGARVPDIMIGSLQASYATTPVLSVVLWALVHGSAFAFGLVLSEKI